MRLCTYWLLITTELASIFWTTIRCAEGRYAFGYELLTTRIDQLEVKLKEQSGQVEHAPNQVATLQTILQEVQNQNVNQAILQQQMSQLAQHLQQQTQFRPAVCNCADLPVNETKQYFVYNDQHVTFFEAWRICQSYGQRLATVTSEEDSRLLEQAIEESGTMKKRWYIAGTDLGNEGHFVWISTNRPIGYVSGYINFAKSQPDNDDENEHCLEVGRYGGVVWNDCPCDKKLRFICESVN